MVDTAPDNSERKKLKVVITILYNHENLKYYSRMDRNNFVSIHIGQFKAKTLDDIRIPFKDLFKGNYQLEGSPYLIAFGIILLEI